MGHLLRCSECARHIFASEPRCPFCGAARSATSTQPAPLTRRLGRAATFAFGVTLAAAGCSDSHIEDDGGIVDAGSSADSGAAEEDAGATDAGEPDDAGPDDAGVEDAGTDSGGIAPPYGAPPP